MTAIVRKDTGEFLYSIHGAPEVVELNTPKGCIAVEDAPDVGMYYLGGKWHYIQPAPGEGHVFDYSSHTWLDARTLNDVRSAHWNRIKFIRDQLEFGGFEYKGNIYDSDQVSQGRIMGAAIAGLDQTWTLANNTTVNLTGDEIKELYAALQMHVSALHERGRLARFNIDAATTPQDIEAVTLQTTKKPLNIAASLL